MWFSNLQYTLVGMEVGVIKESTNASYNLECLYNSHFRNQSFWVPAPQPSLSGWPKLEILSKASNIAQEVVFNLQVSGPNHMSMFIQPTDGVTLVDWSFTKEPLERNFAPPYFVYFSYALDPSPLKFSLTFKVRSNRIHHFLPSEVIVFLLFYFQI